MRFLTEIITLDRSMYTITDKPSLWRQLISVTLSMLIYYVAILKQQVALTQMEGIVAMAVMTVFLNELVSGSKTILPRLAFVLSRRLIGDQFGHLVCA